MPSLAQATQTVADLDPFLFFAFATLTCLSAWGVVVSGNIVRMSVFLLLTLGGAAGLYFILAAEFLAAVQLIVYAGGTLILIVFGVMLTSKSPFMRLRPRTWEVLVAVVVGVAIAALLIFAVISTSMPDQAGPAEAAYSDVQTLGRALLGRYLVPFEVTAVLLLLVMIAAAYMARRLVREET